MTEIKTISLETALKQATVYTDRAMVTRLAEATVDQDHFVLEINNLPPEINETTLQVKAWGMEGIELQEIKLLEKYHSEIPDTKVKTLKDELERLNLENKIIQDKLDILEKQTEFIDSIKVFSSETINKDFERTQPDPDDWDKVLGFLGKGYNKVNGQRYALEKEMDKVSDQIEGIQHALNSISGKVSKLRKTALLEFKTTQPGSLKLALTYQVAQAKWRPFYEARVNSENKKVDLRYYGLVEQRTGEDWSGVALKLSTARPHIGGNPPQLGSWYLDVFIPRPSPKPMRDSMAGSAPGIARKAKKRSGAPPVPAAMDMMMEEMEEEGVVTERYASVEASNGSSVVFIVPGASDVPGDGSSSRQLIMENEFGAEFRYLTIPKLAQLAYLTGAVKNETEFPMLPGQISIFMDGNFIGKSSIKELVTPEEKFELNLGVDESIKVRHKLLKKLGDETGIFSKSKRVNYAYQITIENQRSTPEEVIVRDQVPVSQNEKIKVELKQISPEENPVKNNDKLPDGTIEWKLSLEPKSETTCKFAFAVEHGTDLRITGI